MKRLRETVKDHIVTGHMVYEVGFDESHDVIVDVFDLSSQSSKRFTAKNIIMASPQFVNNRLLKNIKRPGVDITNMHYAPWFIANITVNKLPTTEKGMVLCWDNVAFGTPIGRLCKCQSAGYEDHRGKKGAHLLFTALR
jgi:hypothetical protein